MKRFLFINLLFFSTFLFAQEISDYKFQCKSLLSKSGKLFLDLKNDQSIKLANKALNLAIQNNDDEIAAKAYNLIGLNYSDFQRLTKQLRPTKKDLQL